MKKTDVLADGLREDLASHAKDFKTAWLLLGQGLYAVWQDKLYSAWGYDKFEDYTSKELGLKKPIALKLVKTYFFVEQQEPTYLKKEFVEERGPQAVPSYESLDVLRLAHRNKDLKRDDYVKLRKDVFEKGKDVALVRKDLTAMIKERKQVNPDEEREKRHQQSVKKFFSALKVFSRDMETLKLADDDIFVQAQELLQKIEEKYL